MAWPTTFTEYLNGTSLQAGVDAEEMVLDAVEVLEAATGRVPFLEDEEESDKTFDPPDSSSGRCVLDLPGYRSISAIAWDGTALTEGNDRDYVLIYGPEVRVGSTLETPIDAVEFFVRTSDKRGSIEITGIRGSFSDAPRTVATAVKKLAAAEAIEADQAAAGALVKQKASDGREVGYGSFSGGTNGVTAVSAQYRKDFDAVAASFVRIPRG